MTAEALLHEHEPDGGSTLIEWPHPPFHELSDEFSPAFEGALVTFRDGRKQAGRLMRFAPGSGMIEFCPERAAVAVVLALSDILELRLVRPVRMRTRKSTIDARAATGAPTGTQRFRVELVNGNVVEGETYGFQIHRIGLFLNIRSHQDMVIRTFFPTTAIRDKQIGGRIGELLVGDSKLSHAQLTSALERQTDARARKLGEYLTHAQVIEQKSLHEALEQMRTKPMLRLGEALLQQGAITEAQLAAALQRQKTERGKPLGEMLVDMGFLERAELTRALTQKLGIPFVGLDQFPVDRHALDLVPRAIAIEYNVLPLCMDQHANERSLVVAVENPLDPKPLERIRFHAGMIVTPVMASGDDIRNAVARYFVDPTLDAPIESFAAELATNAGGAVEGDDDGAPELEHDSALVRLVNKTIVDARASGASDIHIESNGPRNLLRIRFRQDGALREYLTLPPNYRRALVSRIKIMAALDISEKRRAQDGKIRFDAGGAPLDLRVATIPTIDGREDVVLRLLSGGAPTRLENLGLRAEVLAEVERLVARPFGIFILCGPTGSGKSTTLHSILGHINKPDLKIWTAEDPVEIQQEGLRQVQVHPRIGWTFAAAMRAFLRADPDVIMVGEMRDDETAQIAIEASLTGHLVFSTLHTNTAVDSVVRLLDMGVQPFNFADSLLGVLSQRLVRGLCPACRIAEPLGGARAAALAEEYCADTPLQPAAVLADWTDRYGAPQSWQALGCESCRGSGYKGRLGVHELFVNSVATTPLIHRRAEARELRAVALKEGMRTLKQDGIEKCLQGLTDMKEVRSACI